MKVADKLNNGFNTNLLTLAVQGTKNRRWELKRDNLSPCYTTRISDIIKVKI
ncbi:DUF4113 domain-containing protein [Dysgonomonas sp. Marseille-P4677]|uniref:DUF4113 domain-containing protein n=1 Tax=Dysgonomonas sp. Marseille-P4677 TaxID=2364790 RepID=UPI001914AC4B|nr:DUF4113 domain-containing protein [Dysgonomonas sp. Marseille-P4677]MBK5722862.1 DUF4113 domain-containing protein [Dysgonomonas sp. Marseille-P4677]